MSNSLTGRKTCERFSMWPFRKNDLPRGLDERLRVYIFPIVLSVVVVT